MNFECSHRNNQLQRKVNQIQNSSRNNNT